MNLNTYQPIANDFAKHEHPDYAFTGLFAEAGEVSDKLAKFGRKHGVSINTAIRAAANPHTDAEFKLREDLQKELGDVLWFVSRCASILCMDLGADIADGNIRKLKDRADRGVIIGEGDNR